MNIADGKTAKNEYVYGKDNLPEKYTIDGGRNVTYTYDSLNRLQKTSIGTTNAVDMAYVYWLSKRNTNGSDKYRTTKIKQETIGGEKYSYEYDDQGNITVIKKMTYNADGSEAGYATTNEYRYDELGQLVYDRDYTQHQLYEYTYDAGGNLLKEHLTIYSTSGAVVTTQDKDYAYADTNWKDKLTSYGGKAITYDEIGNPLSYRGMTMAWQNGRQLASLQKGTTAVSYTYDANSTRATKTVNGVKYTYQYVGGKLIHETRGEKSFHYYYDANGYLTAIKYRLTPDGQDFAYYATHNWRGDVIALYNGDGELRAKYEYDTWGKVTSVKDATGARITDQNHVGNLNPFRYRGYYYDTESQLYYLMSRYYDPMTHRFLNADGYYQSGGALLDTNMNAYCGNSPVSNFDPDGTCWIPVYSTCGAQMGSYWKTMGSVPGVPYCCKKCGKNDPSYGPTNSMVDGLISGANAMAKDLASGAESYISNGTRPNNIGKGTYAKSCSQEIQTIKSFSAKAEKLLKKTGTALAIAATVSDMATGAYNNWQNGAGIGKIGFDMLVDGIVTGGTIWGASSIGCAIGSCIPVVGNIAGAIIGFGVGMALSWAVDEWKPNGQTIRENLKGVVA